MGKKKEMTIEQLARMMQGEFADIHGEFKKVNGVLKIHTDRFDIIEADIKDIKRNVSSLVGESANHEIRLKRVEQEAGILDQE